MSSSYNGIDLFGPGPHRFALARQGESVVANYVISASPPNGSTAQGAIELDVIIRGRLTAASESALWTKRDAIRAQITDPPALATLVDHHGRGWSDMSFIEWIENDRTDRGRVVSIGYTARFRKFL